MTTLTTLGVAYTQNFDTLASSGTSSVLPTGWLLFETGANANTLYTAGTGSGNAGDTYSFGPSGNSERAFGGLLSGSLTPTIGAQFFNNTGATISSLLIAYTGEQWRAGVTNRGAADRLDFQYSLDATSLSTGTWIDVNALDFASPNINTALGALDGNAAANRTAVGSTISGLSIGSGATFWIRWTDFNIAGSDDGLAVDDFSLTPQGVAPSGVNLSLSANAGSEAAATVITVTATASAPVVGNQTVSVAVSGSGITASDYWLSNTVITIPDGQTSGRVSFTINDDARAEGSETATLTLTNPSAGIALGATVSGNVVISNNDSSLLSKVGSATSATASEIPAFDPASDRVFVVAATVVNIYQMDASGALVALGDLAPGFAPPAGTVAGPNSVAIKNGLVAVAYAIKDIASGAQLAGRVGLYNAADGAFLNAVTVGALPDMLAFTPDGLKLLTANEGEPNSYGQGNSVDPEGSVSIIDLSAGAAAASVQTADFSAFNSQAAALKAAGVRLFGPGATVAQDLEPEYLTITPDGAMAIVTLQENNAVAVVDIASATITSVLPLGTQNHNLAGQGLDASDRDGGINIRNWPVQGLLQPDAITSFQVGGQLYFITANEGDARSYTGFSEELRAGAAGYVLDPTAFPDAATLKLNANLGRLTVSNASGDTDNDGDFDVIQAFGSRSFTIWDASGARLFDSGDRLEQITATRLPALFNSDGAVASFDTRSDNKGPEPESVVTGQVGSRTYAFVALERVGDIIVFDVSNPVAPQFVQLINLPEDVSPEGLAFVKAADSPTGKPLLITANEISNTVAVFQIAVPPRIAEIQGASHLSPLLANAADRKPVLGVEGIVTAIAGNGFWIQDSLPDNNPATSEAIFVFTGAGSPNLTPRVVGEALRVSGTLTEFRGGNNPDNLTLTEIVNSNVQPLVIEPWVGAPASGIAPIIINVDRTPPTQAINNDFGPGSGNVENAGDFDPTTEGIDFWESLEGMLVQINAPTAVSPRIVNAGSQEIWVIADGGAQATGLTGRGGIGISAGDFNPERIQIDNLFNAQAMPQVDVGARLSTIVGVVNYDRENYEVQVPQVPTVVQPSALAREVTSITGGTDRLRVATFNVENLDPGDGAAKFNALAQAIVNNLRSPEIINLEEVQDNSGPVNNGVVDADVTLQTLVDAIVAAGGPRYEWRQINPQNNADGGEPGGNIRVVFFFDPMRLSFVDGSLTRLTDPDLGNGDAFANSRKPLVGTFRYNGEDITLVGNHFNSKGGDGPLFGPTQPPVLGSEPQRVAQAEIVKTYVQGLLGANPQAKVIVLGDLNDFEFSPPITVLESAGLTSLIETLPQNERYTYNFEGNAQALDHILASPSLVSALRGYDVVHINSEFGTQVSDHDPVLARFVVERSGKVYNGTAGRDSFPGSPGSDIITGGPGRDSITTGAGSDRIVYTSLLDAGDVIDDFELGADRLVIDALLASVGHAGANAVAEGYLSIVASPARTLVLFDADGAAGAGAPRTLVELTGVSVPNAELLLDPFFGQ